MANLTITAANVRAVRVYEWFPDGPTDEAVSAGQAVKINVSTGRYTKANGSSAAEARIVGIAVSSAAASGEIISVVKRGIVEVGAAALTSLAYDKQIFLSDTDGTLGDTAGTVSTTVGRVVPGWADTTAGKLLSVEL
ncbi:MAG: hypothetical protein ACOYD4_06915 [Solirubrobacterales bacterium]